MTQQFKFGDIAEIKSIGETGIVVGINGEYLYVAVENSSYINPYKAENLHYIPHPDTVRLDWLMEEDIIPEDIYHNTQTEDEDGLPVAYFSKRDCRAAIDAAMQKGL